MGKYVKREHSMKSEGARVGSGPSAQGGARVGSAASAHEDAFGTRVAQHARQILTEEVSQRVGNPAKELDRLARALRATSEDLEGSFVSPYAERAADQLERFSVFVQEARGREAVDAVERFAREQPIAFLSGAFALGIGAGRFLKSSARPASRAELTLATPRPARGRTTTVQSRGNQS